jgi:hypothetical protein
VTCSRTSSRPYEKRMAPAGCEAVSPRLSNPRLCSSVCGKRFSLRRTISNLLYANRSLSHANRVSGRAFTAHRETDFGRQRRRAPIRFLPACERFGQQPPSRPTPVACRSVSRLRPSCGEAGSVLHRGREPDGSPRNSSGRAWSIRLLPEHREGMLNPPPGPATGQFAVGTGSGRHA